MRIACVAVLALTLASCGGGDDDRLTVFAAASLTEAFEEIAPHARFNFAGSDELATQLREGASADVFASASPDYPRELYAESIVDEPQVFATNRLVVIVPADNPAGVRRLGDLARPGVKLVIGGDGVPIGDYTRDMLRRARLHAALENVVSEEDDVKGIVGKVALGEADAGVVYETDARAAAGDVRQVSIDQRYQTVVEYVAAVVRHSARKNDAIRFTERLRSSAAQRVLRAHGFGDSTGRRSSFP